MTLRPSPWDRRHSVLSVLILLTSGALYTSFAVRQPPVCELIRRRDAPSGVGAASARPASERRFRFIYAFTLTGLAPGDTARVWAPLAVTGGEQTVTVDRIDAPGAHRIEKERKFGNSVLYVEASAGPEGTIPVTVEYTVARREASAETGGRCGPEEVQQSLAADRLVPNDDRVVRRLFPGGPPRGDDSRVARALYDRVLEYMSYDKSGRGWGRGDAVWACDSKSGNCTDFHSVFISMARGLKIPAKFEIGFLLPPPGGASVNGASVSGAAGGKIEGYHCWARFCEAGHWVPVDISEASRHPEFKDYYAGRLTADRVSFTTGRDLELQPPPAAGAVNFLVYPYAEVAGKPWTKLVKEFRFEDLPAGAGPDAPAPSGGEVRAAPARP